MPCGLGPKKSGVCFPLHIYPFLVDEVSHFYQEWQLEYQRQFKAEADKAPVIDTPNGPVKIVKVGGYPPVTVPVVLVTKKANVLKK